MEDKTKIYVSIIISILFIIFITCIVFLFVKVNKENSNKEDIIVDNNDEIIKIVSNISLLKKIDDYYLYCDKSKEYLSSCYIKYNDSKYDVNLVYKDDNGYIFEFEIDSNKLYFNSINESVNNTFNNNE